MLDAFKSTVDYLSAPTISFSILTVVTPILFPPTDWFDKINRKLGFYLLWTKTGLVAAMAAITFFLLLVTWIKILMLSLPKPIISPLFLWFTPYTTLPGLRCTKHT